MYVSALRECIRAMGGDRQLVAKFPDVEVKLYGIELANRVCFDCRKDDCIRSVQCQFNR